MIKKYFNENTNATETPWLYHSSSFIQGIKFDKAAGLLYVQIAGKSYHYDVTLDLADEFSRASSWGQFYDANIKEHQLQHAITKFLQPTPKLPSPKPAPQIVQSVVNPTDSKIKDFIGEMWGFAELGMLFMPWEISIPMKLALTGVSVSANILLQKKGIQIPFAIETAIDIAVGASLYAGLKGSLGRAATLYTSVKTPYFNIASRGGAVTARITPNQATNSILFGGTAWKNVLVKIEQRKMALNLLESYKIPGSELYDITDEEIQMVKNFTKFNISRRKVQGAEKILDTVIAHPKYVSTAVSAAYTIPSVIYDIQGTKTEHKPKKKKSKVEFNFAKTGVSVSADILHGTK